MVATFHQPLSSLSPGMELDTPAGTQIRYTTLIIYATPPPDIVCFFSLFAQKNTFQAVIASDGSESYILFLYGDLQWSTGDSDGGSGGTGGAAAVAGINAGDGENYFLLPGSGTASVLNLDTDSNVAVNGEFVLSAGNGNAAG